MNVGKRFHPEKELDVQMGTIVCQGCQCVIDHFEGEKVSTLYGICPACEEK